MEIFRLTNVKYSKSLQASGKANRWNKEEQHVLYAGASRSLVTLESLVHLSGVIPKTTYKMMVIKVKNPQKSIKSISSSQLSPEWRTLSGYHLNQEIGSAWYQNKNKLLLKVPSAVIPEEYNYVLNTFHPEYTSKVSIEKVEDYFWDRRLF